ncbi:MAG: ligase-associated DNA damage response DEXH box helicase [Betaproteobacteria bacterium]|nr:ligase-associated DNA damage response DEXH box helicase [Betaproteobacteria bacterium]
MSAAGKRIDAWFLSKGWSPFAFQREVWQAYRNGESGLIHSATGTGKTLAAWLGPLMEGASSTTAPPLTVLWITPMRALSADTRESLLKPLTEMGSPWTVGLRTGDTPASERAKQNRRMPSALITTPESLSLMLSQPGARDSLSSVKTVVVDEWHELLGTKRGTQTELALARLRRWNPALRVWGLSATLGNLDQAMQVLLAGAPGRLVEGVREKEIVIDTLIPREVDKFPWAGHLGFAMLEEVAREVDAIAETGGTTLIFTNVRSQAELWYQALLEARPEWAGDLALHHGSLDREVRDYVESGLKEGTLKCVVATSSLDLGVDFSPVSRVLQIGSPKGVARLLQRAGRSGHSPGRVSRVTCVPSHAFEFIEAVAARKAADRGKIESRRLLQKPLDVLVQHLVTIAAGDGFVEEELFDEVRGCYAYRDLSYEEWSWALEFVVRGGEALKAYPEYRKVAWEEERFRVPDKAIARRHRMAIGTIVSDASMDVRYMNGSRLGHVEESFIARLSPGDAFTFAGRTLELIRVREMTAYVKPAPQNKKLVPRWMGSKMPLSTELAMSLRERLQEFRDGKSEEPEMRAVARLLKVQRAVSRIPAVRELLLEQLESREGHHIFVYPFAGRHVHMGMAALFAWRLGQIKPATFSISVNEYGFELLSATSFALNRDLIGRMLSTERLLASVLESLNAAELSKRHFREIARVAGLVFQGFPGASKTNKQVQATSGLIFDVFARWDKDNPLLAQSQQEVLERELEFSRLQDSLGEMQKQRVTVVRASRPTPFCFPLMVERFREKLTSEKLADRIARMQTAFDKVAGG